VSKRVRVQTRNVVFFFVDGLNQDVFEQMLREGELPQIERYLLRRGCRVEKAVTTVPSITYAVTATFATGLVPGHHGVMGNRYFDRFQLRFIDYNTIGTYRDIDLDYHVPNIYEILEDRFSVSIQTPLARGVYYHIDNWAISGTCWFLGLYETVDRWTARRFRLISQIADDVNQWPSFIYAYFPGLDQIGHLSGPHSESYREALRSIDRQVGHIASSLARSGLLESTYLIFVSDHGMVATSKSCYFNIEKFLAGNFPFEAAMEGPDRRVSFPRRQAWFERYNAVLCNGAGRRAVLYLRNGSDWGTLADPDQIAPIAERFARERAVCLVAWRAPGGVVLQSAVGRSLVQRTVDGPVPLDRKQYRYRVIDGEDPLGYHTKLCERAVLDGNEHTGREWLVATADSDYPDLPVQIVEFFDHHRAGDLIVFAAEGWTFDPGLLGGHGSVRSGDMVAPLLLAGPGIRRGITLATARMVDIAPTIVDMLEPERLGRHHFDGQSLLPRIRGHTGSDRGRTDRGLSSGSVVVEDPGVPEGPCPRRTGNEPCSVRSGAKRVSDRTTTDVETNP